MARTAELEAAMSDAIDRHEYAAMVARETDDPVWDAVAALTERDAEAAIAAFHAALDAEAADEARDMALWQREQVRVAAEQEADFRAMEAACDGEEGAF